MQRVIQQLVDRIVVDYLAQTPVFRAVATRAVNAKKAAADKGVQAAVDSQAAAGNAGKSAQGLLTRMRDELMKMEEQMEKAAKTGR